MNWKLAQAKVPIMRLDGATIDDEASLTRGPGETAMSETKFAKAAAAQAGGASLDQVLIHLEEALALLDSLPVSPEFGAHLDLLLHRIRDEAGREP